MNVINYPFDKAMLSRLSIHYLLLLVITLTACQSHSKTNYQTNFSNTYNRVLSTGIIRCGYLTYPPYCIKDPNTGTLSGFFVDITEKVGQKLGLKIVWAEEVGYESLFEALRTDRFDLFASGLWPNADRAQVGDFSIPLFYSAVKAYGRKDESRFTNLKTINSLAVKIAVIDSSMEDLIAKEDYPLAKRISLTQLSPFSQNLLNVITKKADITFAEPGVIKLFLKHNPNTLKDLAPSQLLRVFGNTFVFKQGQIEFKNMINTVLEEMLNSGEIEKLLNKYKVPADSYYCVGTPYTIPIK